MRNLTKALAAAAALTTSFTLAPQAVAAPTEGDQPGITIIDGERVPNNRANPGAVVLSSYGSQFCSAVRIAPRWVLSARHCDSTVTAVYTQNVRSMTGPKAGVRRVINAPVGDTMLIELSESTPGPVAAWTDSEPAKGSVVNIYGYGKHQIENERPGAYLKTARARVSFYYKGFYKGRSVSLQCINGCSMRGDSGGPMFTNGRVAGVLSSGNADNSKVPEHRRVSGYTMLKQNASWIQRTTGVAPNGQGYWFDGTNGTPTPGPVEPTPDPVEPTPDKPGNPGNGECGPVTTGTVSNRDSAYGREFQASSGTIQGCLSGPAGTDFDLRLQKQESWGWRTVSRSSGSTSTEKINYRVSSAGTYRFQIFAFKGAGSWELSSSVR